MDIELLNALGRMIDEKLGAAFDEKLKPISDRLSNLEAGQAVVKEDLAFVRDRVVVIEVEHGKKLDTLSDGYLLLHEKLEEHSARFDNLEAKVDDLSLTVGVHDIKLEKLAK